MFARPPDLKGKCKLIVLVGILNIITIPILFVILGSIFGFDAIQNDLIRYARARPDFMLPIGKFDEFFLKWTLRPAFMEETRYRLIPWLILLLTCFSLKISGQKEKIEKSSKLQILIYILVWLPFLIMNYYWVMAHSYQFSYVYISLFFTGLTWSWLIIKTRDWTTSLVSHILANVSIYFFIKILFLIGYSI